MKSSAVVAMMFSADQCRKEDVDLKALYEKKILFTYTDEQVIGVLDSISFKILKALFAAGLSVWRDRYFLVSGGTMGYKIKGDLIDKGARVITSLSSPLYEQIVDCDAIIMADYSGQKFPLSGETIAAMNPLIKIINVSGQFDFAGCRENDIEVFPDIKPRPKGYTTLTGDYLSFKVLFELIVAGLSTASRISKSRKQVDELIRASGPQAEGRRRK
jgi:hypothetical protein